MNRRDTVLRIYIPNSEVFSGTTAATDFDDDTELCAGMQSATRCLTRMMEDGIIVQIKCGQWLASQAEFNLVACNKYVRGYSSGFFSRDICAGFHLHSPLTIVDKESRRAVDKRGALVQEGGLTSLKMMKVVLLCRTYHGRK
jgi:hypothetical protein